MISMMNKVILSNYGKKCEEVMFKKYRVFEHDTSPKSNDGIFTNRGSVGFQNLAVD